jgi:hypothetical protein
MYAFNVHFPMFPSKYIGIYNVYMAKHILVLQNPCKNMKFWMKNGLIRLDDATSKF